MTPSNTMATAAGRFERRNSDVRLVRNVRSKVGRKFTAIEQTMQPSYLRVTVIGREEDVALRCQLITHRACAI